MNTADSMLPLPVRGHEANDVRSNDYPVAIRDFTALHCSKSEEIERSMDILVCGITRIPG
jgi:hypothetical protein